MNQYEEFKNLHQPGHPLLLGNCWNVSSARLLETSGFKAIATSSLAVAHTLGYEDGEQISFDELMFVAKRIRAAIRTPFTVDLERGLSEDIEGIVRNIEQLVDMGVAGINIEDSKGYPDGQKMDPASMLVEKITAIKEQLAGKKKQIFINARTDAYFLHVDNPLEISIDRSRAYATAGADGIFVPFVKEANEIKHLTQATHLPVNVLSVPGLPNFAELAACRVGRISLGSSWFRAVYRSAEKSLSEIKSSQSVQPLF